MQQKNVLADMIKALTQMLKSKAKPLLELLLE